MFRFVFAFVVLFATLCATLASPVPSTNGTTTFIDLEKRITHMGRGTWFHPGEGNCGQWNTDNDPIVAMAKVFYDNNGGSNCGQWLKIVNTGNNHEAMAYVHDSCPSCEYNDLDMSPMIFSQLAGLDVGQIQISWYFMPQGWHP